VWGKNLRGKKGHARHALSRHVTHYANDDFVGEFGSSHAFRPVSLCSPLRRRAPRQRSAPRSSRPLTLLQGQRRKRSLRTPPIFHVMRVVAALAPVAQVVGPVARDVMLDVGNRQNDGRAGDRVRFAVSSAALRIGRRALAAPTGSSAHPGANILPCTGTERPAGIELLLFGAYRHVNALASSLRARTHLRIKATSAVSRSPR